MTSPDETGHPFAAEGGLPHAPIPLSDPFRALDELMVVVEELCPVWPERSTFAGASGFKL